ncbi:unnamed protein product [Oncorhynchus mykiss]|uniref:Reverse transcriptase domain-containing protein n=1 Tax=Oncorhynchus mykiss TaxID=8022 RepID=A0A060X9D0_ONCMY|nr:unnamed protein product [Oncorhynchus mykiss]
MLKVLNDIITIFIHLAKAFDSVNHCTLIGRLNSLGFSNYCLAWFTKYFSDRVLCVKSEGLLSGPLAEETGSSLSQCHPFCHQSPIYYPPLRPVCSRWLVLATYASPNPLAPVFAR